MPVPGNTSRRRLAGREPLCRRNFSSRPATQDRRRGRRRPSIHRPARQRRAATRNATSTPSARPLWHGARRAARSPWALGVGRMITPDPLETAPVSVEVLKQRLGWAGFGAPRYVKAVAEPADGERMVAVVMGMRRRHFWGVVATARQLLLARRPRLRAREEHSFVLVRSPARRVARRPGDHAVRDRRGQPDLLPEGGVRARVGSRSHARPRRQRHTPL